MINNNNLILNFVSRIGIFACLAIIGLLLSGFSALLITSIWGESTVTLRISTVIQNIFFFITPAIISALFITRLPADFLRLRNPNLQ